MKLLLLLLIFLSFSAWSKVTMELRPASDSVKQGEIIAAKLIVKEASGQSALAGLKGKKISKTLYLLSVSPFMGKQGVLEADAKIIFLTVPESSYIMETINGEEVAIHWANVDVQPTEETKSFLLGDFEIPERKELLPWILGILGLSILALFGIWIKNKLQGKEKKKLLLIKTKQEVLGCSSYDDVVAMWRNKRNYLQTFPQLEGAFQSLEVTLFKYQFKPQRTSWEVEEVMSAYNKFKSDAQGVLNGI